MKRTRRLAGVAVAGALAMAVAVALAMGGARPGGGGAGGEGGRDGDGGDERRRAVALVAELRDAVDACNAEIEAQQARFQAHEDRVDSLRAVVMDYESAERTVPAEVFDAYIAAFNAYNESVGVWHERADALQASWDSCRDLAERHNALVDSLSGPSGPDDALSRAAPGDSRDGAWVRTAARAPTDRRAVAGQEPRRSRPAGTARRTARRGIARRTPLPDH